MKSGTLYLKTLSNIIHHIFVFSNIRGCSMMTVKRMEREIKKKTEGKTRYISRRAGEA